MTTRRWLYVGLLAGLALRAVTLPLRGTGDVKIWKTWAYAASADLTGAYGVGGSPAVPLEHDWHGFLAPVDYPPLSLIQLGAVGRVYRQFVPSFADSPILTTLVKFPSFAWEVLFVGVVLTWGRRRFGEHAATRIALAWWLNPAVILNGAVLGYLDFAMAVPAVLALCAAWAGASRLSVVLLLVALMTKAQAVFVAPACAIALWRWAPRDGRSIARAVVAATATVAAVVGPFVARGAAPNLLMALRSLATHDMLSGYAANVWWIVGWAFGLGDAARQSGWWYALTELADVQAISYAVELGFPNPRLVGAGLVAAAFLWAAWSWRRLSTLSAAAALAAWCVHTYFVFAAQVHENHIALALPFITVAAALDARMRGIFVAVSAIAALNLVLFFGTPVLQPLGITRGITVIDATIWLSVANIAVWVWHTIVLKSQRPTPSTPPRGAAS
ncbi:MAG: hypothetical protein KAY59_09015 [Acidobacteria bacterium]|nr:hypothetical protein [Acidobacteriota bacterium]